MKIFKLVTLIFIILILVTTFQKNNQAVLDSKSVDIYYARTIDQELLCWQNSCFKSLVSADRQKLVEVKKPFFSFSKKLLTIEDKFHNIDTPIYNYVVKDKNIWLTLVTIIILVSPYIIWSLIKYKTPLPRYAAAFVSAETSTPITPLNWTADSTLFWAKTVALITPSTQREPLAPNLPLFPASFSLLPPGML